MIQVLIVDAEEDLLWALSKNLFKDRKDLKIRTAATGEDALEILKSHKIDLLISDTRVGGDLDGFNMILRAKDHAPGGKLVVMTAFSDDDESSFQPSLGVAHFINKPFDTNQLRELGTDVLEEGESFRGLMSDLGLADIIALLCLCKRTVLLHLNHRGRRGRIEVHEGEIAHAQFEDHTGAEAVWTMLGLKAGDIFMQSDFAHSEVSVEPSWKELLEKAKEWLDENGWPPEPEPEVEIPVEGWDEDPDGGDDGAFDNLLGFTDEELQEIADAEPEAAPLAPPPQPQPAPNPPSHAPQRPPSQSFAPDPGSGSLGIAASTLDEVVTAMSEEIPSFVAADIVDLHDGASVAGMTADDEFDREVFSVFYSEVVRTALRASTAFGEAYLDALQITTAEHYVLARVIGASPYAQIIAMNRDGNLGIAQVVMRRLDGLLASVLPH